MSEKKLPVIDEYRAIGRREVLRQWVPPAIAGLALAGFGFGFSNRPGRHRPLPVEALPRPRDWRIDSEAEGRIATACGGGPAANLNHFKISPHIDRHHIEVVAHSLFNIGLGQVVLDQCVAVRAPGLMKEQHQPLALGRGFIDVFFKIQEAFLEPRGHHGLFGAGKGAAFDLLGRMGDLYKKETNGQR